MARSIISRTINQLFGGVSQQPPQLRSDSQCELMDNCWPDPAVGLTKRPPSKLVAKLNTDTSGTRAVHFINRDNTERYTVLASGDGTLKVYDLADGTAKTVTVADGSSYLYSGDPRNDFRFLTVADTTFVLNRSVEVGMDDDADATQVKYVTFVLLSTPADHASCTGGKMRIVINGVNFDSAIGKTISQHTTDLANQIIAHFPTWSVTAYGGNSIHVRAPAGVDLKPAAYALDETYWWTCNLTANPNRFRMYTNVALNGNVGFVYITAAVARQIYTVTVDGVSYSYSVAADSSNALTTTVAEGLRALIPSATYTATRIGSCIRISRNDNAPFSLSATDSYGDNGLVWFTDEVTSQAQLPTNFWENVVIAIKGGAENAINRVYVKFVEGRWKETVATDVAKKLTRATMPHKLVRQADGTFRFSMVDWAERKVGDDDSNPIPSFVGKKLNNLFFYRERLGFLAEENIIMSKTSDYYNFWSTSVAAVTDDDPIDITVADPKVAQLYFALPFQEALLVFSDTAQFQLTGDDVLSPKTVRLDATTKYAASLAVAPVAVGRTVFFPVDRGQWSSVREYFLMSDVAQSDAVDVTAHAPSYVPKNLRGFTSSSLIDALFTFSADEPNVVYLHKFLWNGDQKVQSAWGRLVFPTNENLMAIHMIDTRLYMVFNRSGGTFLSYIDFQPNLTETGMAFAVHLDCTKEITGVYDSITNKTTWTCPHSFTGEIQVVLGQSFGNLAGLLVNTSPAGSNAVETTGDFSAGACFVGMPYTMRYRFSELFLKDSDKTAITNGRLMLRNMSVEFTDTSYFRGEVTPYRRDKATYTFNGSYLGTATAIIGRVFLASDEFKFPIITENRGAQIDLVNDSHLPSTFQTISWEALFAPRSRRV